MIRWLTGSQKYVRVLPLTMFCEMPKVLIFFVPYLWVTGSDDAAEVLDQRLGSPRAMLPVGPQTLPNCLANRHTVR